MSEVSFLHSPSDYSVLERECVIMDSSSIVKYYGFTHLMERYYPILQKTKRSFLLPKGSVRELTESMQKNYDNKVYCDSVVAAIRNINFLVEEGLFKYVGSADDSSSEVILKYLVLNRKNREITVVTQDGALYEDIVGLNRLRTAPAPAVLVRRLVPNGNLEEFREAEKPTATLHRQEVPTFAVPNTSTAKTIVSEQKLLDAAIESFRQTLEGK